MNYILWNMFSNLKNGQSSKKQIIFQKKTTKCLEILNILWDEGFILGYKTCSSKLDTLKVFLKYKNNSPVINSLTLLTKPGARFYYSAKQLWKLDIAKGLLIVSTSKGFMTVEKCKKLKLGGEPFFIIK